MLMPLNLYISFFQRVGGQKPLNAKLLRNSLASFGYFCPAHALGQSKWSKGRTAAVNHGFINFGSTICNTLFQKFGSLIYLKTYNIQRIEVRIGFTHTNRGSGASGPGENAFAGL